MRLCAALRRLCQRLLATGAPPKHPPLPDNPYRRFYTKTPDFADLVRRTREAEKQQEAARKNNG